MSVLDDPAAAAATPQQEAPAPAVSHLARAEGIELLGHVEGSGFKAGAALVRRADGQMVQLGPLLYELLDCIDGERSLDELAAAMTERLGRNVETPHVVAIAKKLGAQGLLAGTEDAAPAKSNPLLALRWKLLVTDPRITGRLTRPFTALFTPWVLFPVLALFAATLWFVLVERGIAGATAQAFERPGLLLLITGLVVLSAGFHELGHAAACRYGGARPGGIGVGLYLVWPAFYTDVTDAYRLPRRSRLRVDLGGLYFNCLVAVTTMGVWLLTGIDAVLLLIALQLIEMVKQLSPMIRADGYHILADLTGVPDLFAHIGPTLRQLLPGRHEPSALHGRARAIVTVWVLVVVPLLLALAVTAILLLPRLAASAWASARELVSSVPEAGPLGVPAVALQLVALALPVLGCVVVMQNLARTGVRRARSWSAGSAPRTAVAALAGVALVGGLAYAWLPDGQYEPVRGDEDWTVPGLVQAAAPGVAPAVAADQPPQIEPGRHLAVAMIPRGGATEQRPAIYVIRDRDGERPPVAVVSTDAPEAPQAAAAAAGTPGAGTAGGGSAAPAPGEPPPATATDAASPEQAPPAKDSEPSTATVFPFKLPDAPREGDTQAVAKGQRDGAVTYDIAYAVVTVKDGADVTQRNGAYALASCKACATIAVSFQVVLVVGQSDRITPVNVAEALNVNCPQCITAAFATQIVISLTDDPSPDLLERLNTSLKRLDGIPSLRGDGAVARELADIQREINDAIDDSGLRASQQTSTTADEAPAEEGTSTTSTTPASEPDGAPAPDGEAPTTTAPTTTPAEEPAPATPQQEPETDEPAPAPEDEAPTTTTPATTTPTQTTPAEPADGAATDTSAAPEG